MANTYTQLHIHIVFAVRGRQNLLPRVHHERIEQYLTGIVQRRKHKMLAVKAMPDHVHLLIGLSPDQSLSDLVRDIKTGSTNMIKTQGWVKGRFCWQEGFGAFSYAHSQISQVARYIQRQEEHHRRKTFNEEYSAMLERFQVEYDARFIFEPVE